MKSRIVPLLLGLLVAAPLANAQKVDFTALRRRIEAELDRPARQRIRTLNRLATVVTPQARRLLLELWDGEKNTRIRATLLRLLAKHADDEVLDVMRDVLLTTGDAGMRRTAAWGLVTQKKPGITVLTRALRNGNESVRSAVIPALGGAARKNKRAARALADALKRLTGRAREQALRALAFVEKTPPLLEALVGMLDESNPRLRSEALRQLAMAAHAGMKTKLLALAADDSVLKQAGIRNAILFALASIPDNDTMPVLLGLAMEGDASVRVVMTGLSRLPTHAVRLVRKLRGAVRELESAVDRLTAVELLAYFKTKESDQAVVEALADKSTAVTLAAISIVSLRGLKRALPRLRKLFEGRHPELRLEAMLAIHQFRKKDPGWPVRLMELLDSPKLGIRCRAVDLLADMSYARAVTRVQSLCSAQEFQLRSAAYGYLRKVRHKSSVPVLITALGRESGRLEGEVLGALVELTDRTYPAQEYWKSWWTTAKDTFELPRIAKAKKGKRKGKGKGKDKSKEAERRRAGVVTYYGIPVLTKRACFIVDVSGSMKQRAGTARYTKMHSAKKALQQVISNCDPDLYFNVIPFEGRIHSWARQLQEASKAHKEEAKAFVRGLQARGATNVYDALRTAFDDVSVDTIYLLSDGQPSAGKIIDPRTLADAVRRWNHERRIVIHTISFGRDSALLRQLAKESGGRYVRYI